MHFWRPRLTTVGFVAWLVALVVPTAAVETGQSDDDAEGQITYELTLSARQIKVIHEPALRADDPAFAALLAWSPGAVKSAVRVGRLEGNRSLNIGTLGPGPAPKEAPRSGPKHELWLTRDADGWALDARPPDVERAPRTDADNDASGDAETPADEAEDDADAAARAARAARRAAPGPVAPGRIPLTHQRRSTSADLLTVTLVPDGDDSGQLALLWGENYWTTDFEFVTLPRPATPERTSDVGPATSLTADSDTSARYRGAMLRSRNETALVTPDGAHIQILFQKELGTDGDDYAALESLGDGDLVQLTQGAVIRLRTEVPLEFDDTLVPTDNLAPDFPGSYGLWLKKVGTDWSLVFNNEPDSWGSQHDPAFDATEIDVAHTQGGPSDDGPLAVYLAPRDDGRVGLVIHWGDHLWAADFRIGR